MLITRKALYEVKKAKKKKKKKKIKIIQVLLNRNDSITPRIHQ